MSSTVSHSHWSKAAALIKPEVAEGPSTFRTKRILYLMPFAWEAFYNRIAGHIKTVSSLRNYPAGATGEPWVAVLYIRMRKQGGRLWRVNNWSKRDVQSATQRIMSLNAREVMSSKNIGLRKHIGVIHGLNLLVCSIPLYEAEHSIDTYRWPNWQDILNADHHGSMRADVWAMRINTIIEVRKGQSQTRFVLLEEFRRTLGMLLRNPVQSRLNPISRQCYWLYRGLKGNSTGRS
jgi:hypothetical protein